MAKTPQPGRSKTRLIPSLGAEAAAALSSAFLRDTTENIARAAEVAPIDGFVAYAPAGLEPLLAGHLAAGTRLLLADGSPEMPAGVEGFGRALLHAIRGMLEAGYAAACVLNSDGPTLPTSLLVEAAAALALPGDRAVLGPAEDGGYYLLGVKAAHAALFEEVAWSTATVAEQTRARAGAIGLSMTELAPWFDVDDPASLRRLLAELDAPSSGPAPFPAPATRARIAALGLRKTLPDLA